MPVRFAYFIKSLTEAIEEPEETLASPFDAFLYITRLEPIDFDSQRH